MTESRKIRRDLKRGDSEKFALFSEQTSIVLQNLFTWVPARVYFQENQTRNV